MHKGCIVGVLMDERSSGILLHMTSLPSEYGIGDLGPAAYEFADYLYAAGQRYWQVLPFTPIDPGTCNSPYSSPSAFAGNRILVSPRLLIDDGFLREEDMEGMPPFPEDRVDYSRAIQYKDALLDRAYRKFIGRDEREDFDTFRRSAAHWLRDHVLFRAIKDHLGGAPWTEWPSGLRDRRVDSLESVEEQLSEAVEREEFYQFLFFRQWKALRSYCNDNGIKVIGDIPFYVSLDSADVWANRGLFKLDYGGRPEVVAGVPPDYFSRNGQLWGNPVYRWEAHERDDYAWWTSRLAHNLAMFDTVRIDHFRGFCAYWEVKLGLRTARKGRWVEGPGDALLSAFRRAFPSLPVIAEDLGVITDDVRGLMARFDLPGMRVLQFGFGTETDNPNSPGNIPENCVVYTGTHDNNTSRGWFRQEATGAEKRKLEALSGRKVSAENLSECMIGVAEGSAARTAIIPVQDVLGLGSEARMNVPGKAGGNWEWRMTWEQLKGLDAEILRGMTEEGGRR